MLNGTAKPHWVLDSFSLAAVGILRATTVRIPSHRRGSRRSKVRQGSSALFRRHIYDLRFALSRLGVTPRRECIKFDHSWQVLVLVH